MPYVQVTWVAGRTPEQKRKLAERITQALIEDGRAERENIQVTFVDLPPTAYAEAGVTVADQNPTRKFCIPRRNPAAPPPFGASGQPSSASTGTWWLGTNVPQLERQPP